MDFNLSTFLNAIGAIFRRDELSRSCQATSKKIQKEVLSELHHVERVFGAHKPKSDAFKNLSSSCSRITGNSNLLSAVDKGMRNALVMLDMVEREAEEIFSEEEATVGMSFKKATYLRLTASIEFSADYALKMLNWLVANEIASKESTDIKEQFTPADIEYIEGNAVNFFKVIEVLLKNTSIIEKAIKSLPDVPVSNNSEAALSNKLLDTSDGRAIANLVLPINISVKWNPFYLIGTMIADFQVRSYKATEEQIKLLQMRRMRLEQMNAGQDNPRLQAEIDHVSSRVQQYNYELLQAKEKYGV